MPQLVRIFQSGRMNKDLDERLVPNGEYRDALNLDLANSEGSNVGVLQNVKGTLQLTNKKGVGQDWTSNIFSHLNNAYCIGTYANNITECIYWFIASDSISIIAEYNQSEDVLRPVLVDTDNILKFSKDFLITGINVIEDLLFWTDNQTEPKKININKFKVGSTDFSTHTKIPKYNQETEVYNNDLTGTDDFTEQDVVVIKKSPLKALTLNMAASEYGANIPGTGVTPLATTNSNNFTFIPNTIDENDVIEALPTHAIYEYNLSQSSSYYNNSNLTTLYPDYANGINITINTLAPEWKEGRIIVLKGSAEDDDAGTTNYTIRAVIVSTNNLTIKIKILSISSDLIATPSITWSALLEEKQPLFEKAFPRFAYRWKYIDNEYSSFSPFSQVAFLSDGFKYLSDDGFNTGMTNNLRKLILEDIEWGSSEVTEIDILYKASNSNVVYEVETLKRNKHTNPNGSLINSFEIETEIIGNAIQANQLLRPWDNVPRKAKAQELIANRIVYGNYLQNYKVNNINVNARYISEAHPNQDDFSTIRTGAPSLKSIRKYQTGIVFKDQYGRETPVVADNTGGIDITVDGSAKINKIQLHPTGTAPSWATHYKVFVKDTSNEYYNIALDRYYDSDDGNMWLSFPSSERNKITEDMYLILKKQHATSDPVTNIHKYKVLAISNEAPDSLIKSKTTIAKVDVELYDSGRPTYTEDAGSLTFSFYGPDPANNTQFGRGFNSKASIILSDASNQTKEYKIKSGGPSGRKNPSDDTEFVYKVEITEPLGEDASFLNDKVAADTIFVTLLQEDTDILPEYLGKFFVKIHRDSDIDKNIVSSFEDEDDIEYGILNSFEISPYVFLGANQSHRDAVWVDIGRSDASRKVSHGFQCPWRYPGMCSDKSKFTIIKQYAIRGEENQPHTWLDGAMDGLQHQGTLIRFADSAGNTGKIYTIKDVEVKYGRRAKDRERLGSNGAIHFNITLEQDYDDFDLFTDIEGDNVIATVQILKKIIDNDKSKLSSSNPAIFETEPIETNDLDIYYEASNALPISQFNDTITLDYSNVFSFGNGVESNRIRDDFNAVTIDKGVKASSIIEGPYQEERRSNGFIFSQIFNSTSGVNRLNQFIQAEPITKDINPIYGSIQKIYARDTDLISLCEDKCLRILANKDALFNADGNTNITSNNAVLGQAVPYAGEYGISKNPESFASHEFRVYFTDKNRGVVIRLSRDGITVISDNGMSDFFADNLRANNSIIGSYDKDKGLYNVTLNTLTNEWQSVLDSTTATTVSYKEDIRGWTSRKSFIPDTGISLNNVYYTFKDGSLYQNNASNTYNNFYGNQYSSAFSVVINESPQVVKGFATVNYSGSKSKELEYQYNGKWYSIAEINANQTIPTNSQTKTKGWFIDDIETNLDSGVINEFEKKEDKYFNYIKVLKTNDTSQGIGSPTSVTADPQDYVLTLTIDNSTCS